MEVELIVRILQKFTPFRAVGSNSVTLMCFVFEIYWRNAYDSNRINFL
jgi:hypothetical protein